jgi:hypothetical protein
MTINIGDKAKQGEWTNWTHKAPTYAKLAAPVRENELSATKPTLCSSQAGLRQERSF